MTTQSFVIPDLGNQITESDIKSATIRITVSFKSYFPSSKSKISLIIGNETFEASYSQREGRSDILSIGKKAMASLNIKPFSKLKFIKLESHKFQIEKL
jgi:hypothetical protein